MDFVNGKVQWFDTKKGFGFIRPEGADKDVFVHASGLIDTIKADDEVEFTIVDGEKGKVAEQVVLLQNA